MPFPSDVPLSDLVRRWQRGWGTARSLSPPVEEDGALRVHFGFAHRHDEYVLLDVDREPDTIRAVAARVLDSPHTDWVTVPTTVPDKTTLLLQEAGLAVDPGYETLMDVDLEDHPVIEPPRPYGVTVGKARAVIRVRITTPQGDEAASGAVGVGDDDAVADAIVTEPEHRRRGLGGAVMSALAEHARRAGATRGVLMASSEGRHLYTSLGWSTRATVLIARAPRAIG
ncbi:GNAT family N-acetyltransferase [Nocardiopsis sp. N85]|uniref:GNAT family N-acetyltransferase n=1 Tax=Nocardiopsis sp. N85 TaxID=3029400 RepID=UPI00237FB5D5|nr:GNAT family N-acetyltransferase [Nocardiopsis sp. N85]MDE3722115.1 GNAT family N-acetyltransferase [Nocardiopsis sp. N85]